MRIAIVAVAALVGTAALAPTASHADPYRWCAQYGMNGDGGRNCGFTTFAQCQATVSGIGGFCERNQFYTGPDRRHRKQSRND